MIRLFSLNVQRSIIQIESKRANIKKVFQVFLLLLPGLVVFGLFTIYPIVKMFIMSFFDWRIGAAQVSSFVGFKNYIRVFEDQVSRVALWNTVSYTLVTVPGQIVIGLFVAVLLNSIKKFKIAFRVSYYLPVITSWVIVSVLFRYIFNNEGYLNYFLKEVINVTDANIKWLETRSSAMFVLELLGIWKGVGWNMVIFLAALSTVPKELYEVADTDGCGSIKKFFYITIPCIKNTILFAFVMLTIGAFNVFTSIKLITDGRPLHKTEVVLSWMYNNAFTAGDFGYAAALSYIVALIITVLTLIQFKYFEKFKN